jgi:hypothetical protein
VLVFVERRAYELKLDGGRLESLRQLGLYERMFTLSRARLVAGLRARMSRSS